MLLHLNLNLIKYYSKYFFIKIKISSPSKPNQKLVNQSLDE
jgi:hypothetical protein